MFIAMTGVFVNDPITAFKYYTEVLGFKQHTYMPEMKLAVVISPEAPQGSALLLEPNDNPVAKTYQQGIYNLGMPAIVMGTQDVQAEYEKLAAKGVTFRKTPTKTDWGTEAIFEDTCGNLISLYQQ